VDAAQRLSGLSSRARSKACAALDAAHARRAVRWSSRVASPADSGSRHGRTEEEALRHPPGHAPVDSCRAAPTVDRRVGRTAAAGAHSRGRTRACGPIASGPDRARPKEQSARQGADCRVRQRATRASAPRAAAHRQHRARHCCEGRSAAPVDSAVPDEMNHRRDQRSAAAGVRSAHRTTSSVSPSDPARAARPHRRCGPCPPSPCWYRSADRSAARSTD
jgi:hypothetical protein